MTSHLDPPGTRSRRRVSWDFSWFAVVAGVTAIFYFGLDFALGDRTPQVRALCDQQVEILLHSHDLVDVTRAGIIVRQVDCSISRRLKGG